LSCKRHAIPAVFPDVTERGDAAYAESPGVPYASGVQMVSVGARARFDIHARNYCNPSARAGYLSTLRGRPVTALCPTRKVVNHPL
jgi:hypothetical protein